MINIDFQAGSHGNFLEVVCNVMADVPIASDPFISTGAAHLKTYQSDRVFVAKHYSIQNRSLYSNRVISISITPDDLLPLSQISFLRGGDYGYDNNKLEIDTYNKLNNPNYRGILDIISNSFFVDQIKTSYDAVKDSSWPNIETLAEFNQLPEHIQRECQDVHNLKLFAFDSAHPDCPRHVLREFFQLGFETPGQHGFITNQETKMVYSPDIDVYYFPYSSFYDQLSFLHHVEQVAQWANISYNTQTQVIELHNKFLNNQPYKNSKNKCDQLIQQMINNTIETPVVDLLEEAYINATLKKLGYECRY